MHWLGLPFTIAVSDIEDEIGISHVAHPADIAEQLAVAKARHVAERDRASNSIVLGFDTLVVIDDEVLGKPGSHDEAHEMLGVLSGRTHEVITGVAAVETPGGSTASFTHTTPVLMKDLSDSQLEEWLSGDEVLGCAGAYNIERHLAEVALDECFQNVAGLPLCHTYSLLRETSDLTPSRPDHPCDAARGVCCRLAPRLLGGDRSQ